LFDSKTGQLTIKTLPVFEPLLQPARYKGVWGGRGSGKSHFFAELVVDEHVSSRGMRTLCVREVLKSLKESAKLLIEDKIQALGVGHLFEVQKDLAIWPPYRRIFALETKLSKCG
jgi:phage terminase large subunit